MSKRAWISTIISIAAIWIIFFLFYQLMKWLAWMLDQATVMHADFMLAIQFLLSDVSTVLIIPIVLFTLTGILIKNREL